MFSSLLCERGSVSFDQVLKAFFGHFSGMEFCIVEFTNISNVCKKAREFKKMLQALGSQKNIYSFEAS